MGHDIGQLALGPALLPGFSHPLQQGLTKKEIKMRPVLRMLWTLNARVLWKPDTLSLEISGEFQDFSGDVFQALNLPLVSRAFAQF
ncbi:hypothetical protein RSAG8_13630, partial [Rhizoctonia solani AG-8 WAC10335]